MRYWFRSRQFCRSYSSVVAGTYSDLTTRLLWPSSHAGPSSQLREFSPVMSTGLTKPSLFLRTKLGHTLGVSMTGMLPPLPSPFLSLPAAGRTRATPPRQLSVRRSAPTPGPARKWIRGPRLSRGSRVGVLVSCQINLSAKVIAEVLPIGISLTFHGVRDCLGVLFHGEYALLDQQSSQSAHIAHG